LEQERQRTIRARNRALLAVLVGLVALFYAITIGQDGRLRDEGMAPSSRPVQRLATAFAPGFGGQRPWFGPIFCFSAALSPLFARATGLFGGNTQRAGVRPPSRKKAAAVLTVRLRRRDRAGFSAGEFRFPLAAGGHRFIPAKERQGSSNRAVNKDHRTHDRAPPSYNVTPAKGPGIYFDKLQCFCFTEQHCGSRAEGEAPTWGCGFFFVDSRTS